MSRIKEFFNRHQVMIPFLVIALITGMGFWRIEDAAKERRRQICKAEIEDRILIDDIINFVANNNESSQNLDLSNLPPELQQLVEQSQANAVAFNAFANDRLDIPPDICEGTGITEDLIREEQDNLKEDFND